MDDVISRFAGDLAGRLTGPLSFRLFLQPAVAILLAVKDGIADGRLGRPAFAWAAATDAAYRRVAVASGWASMAKVFAVALGLDGLYQAIALRWFYPGEALVVAVLLAIVPYVLLRGPVGRIARRAHSAPRGVES